MKQRTLMGAVIAAVSISTGAHAQTAVAPNTGVIAPNAGAVTPSPGVVAPNSGFVNPNTGLVSPNTGFNPFNGFTGTTVDPRFVDPRLNFFDPRLSINGSALGFTPGVTPGNQFVPGFGTGFVGPFWGPWGYSGPTFNSLGPWNALSNRGFVRNTGVPVAGVNSPPLRRGRVRVTRIVDGGSGSGYDHESLRRADELARFGNPAAVMGPRNRSSEFGGATQGVTTGTMEVDPNAAQVADAPGIVEGYGPNGITGGFTPAPTRTARAATRARFSTQAQEIPGVVNVSSIDPQQIRVANHVQDVMDDRPLTEGTVLGRSDGGIMVQYQQNGETVSRVFPRGEVFYFGQDDRLLTASTGIRTGTSVLIPLPGTSRVESQAVAGSRQEFGGQSRTMGTRSTIRGRRPAK